MKTLSLLLCFCLPVFSFAQGSYTIKGNIQGYDNGTPVSFYNQSSQKLEPAGTIQDDSFTITGTQKEPRLEFLVFDNKPPAIPLFVDHSEMTITGHKDSLSELKVSGSPSHDDFLAYAAMLSPYNEWMQPNKIMPKDVAVAVADLCEKFVVSHKSSAVSPLAVYQYFEASADGKKALKLLEKLDKKVQNSMLAGSIRQQVSISGGTVLGGTIPDFSQGDVNGKPVSIKDFRGKYVLIDFWASWCGPCRQENPNVVANYKKYKDKNFTVLGVSLDESKSAWKGAIAQDHLNWTQVSDLKGWNNEVSRMFHISSIPQNFLIDPEGKIIAKNLRGGALAVKLKELFP